MKRDEKIEPHDVDVIEQKLASTEPEGSDADGTLDDAGSPVTGLPSLSGFATP